MTDTTNAIPEDVMQAARLICGPNKIARAIMAERERTAARLNRVEILLKRAGEALRPFSREWKTGDDPIEARLVVAWGHVERVSDVITEIKEAIDD